MSIVIQNITERDGLGKYGSGVQSYELRINRKVIAKFIHTFEAGLGACLQAAAKAADDPERIEVQDDMDLIRTLVGHTRNHR